MKVRGNVKISGDLLIQTQNSLAKPGHTLYAVNPEGEVTWGNIKIPDVDAGETYERNSIIVGPSGDLYIARVHGADGGDLTSTLWIQLTNAGGGATDLVYTRDSLIPNGTSTAEVGGIGKNGVFETASDFDPPQKINDILDAMLFPTTIPTKNNEVVTMTLETSAGIDVFNKMVEIGTSLDIMATMGESLGTWSPNSELLYLPPNEWSFNMSGTIITRQATNSATKTITGTAASYSFIGTSHLLAGITPTDNKGVSYTGTTAKDVSVPTSGSVEISFGFPIFIATLATKYTAANIEANVTRAMLTSVTNGDGLTLPKTLTKANKTTDLVCSLKFPYILVPDSYGKSLTSFFDEMSSKDYVAEFDVVPFNLTLDGSPIPYKAYIFKNATSIDGVANRIVITIA